MSQPLNPKVYSLLSSIDKAELSIVETGCVHTRNIAAWVRDHPDSKFVCVDLNFSHLLETHRQLEKDNTARYCTFLTQEPLKWLVKATWLDVAFLNPDNLLSGLNEFNLAMSAGARLIVLSDYQSSGAWAIRDAKKLGWEFEFSGNLNILRRAK
jgi:hypothetical protein